MRNIKSCVKGKKPPEHLSELRQLLFAFEEVVIRAFNRERPNGDVTTENRNEAGIVDSSAQ